jgi:predicted phage terminase large subunit-like protein
MNFSDPSLTKAALDLQLQLQTLMEEYEETSSLLQSMLTEEAVENSQKSLYHFYQNSWDVFETVPFLGNWHLQCICEHLEAVFHGDIQNIIFECPPRHSKLLASSTPILTPQGWTTHGQLKEGDLVYHSSGNTTKVISRHPNDVANILITFTNGESIKCNEDHIWAVYDRYRHRNTVKNYDTKTLIDLWNQSNQDRSRFQLPNISALEKPSANLPLHPYFLGLWLGDGHSKAPRITHHAADLQSIERLAELGFSVTSNQNKGVDAIDSYFGHQDLPRKLKELNVWGNKHIPEIYIHSSIEQRCELIAGLIDSDGHVGARDRVRIVNTNWQIIEGAYEILLSLGQRPHIYEAEPSINNYGNWNIQGKLKVYTLAFQPTIPFPTAIPRKKISRLCLQPKIGFKKIEYLPEEDWEIGNCITVEAEDGMYLCGKNLIPTHNSSIINIAFPVWSWIQKPALKFITCAHGDSLAVRDSVKSRQLIESPWFQKNWGKLVALKPGSNQKSKYENTSNGYRIATSISGRAVGEGYDILIVDDPHKPKEINSKPAIQAVIEWWTGTMTSRKNSPDSRRVVMHQRLSDEDLIGFIRENDSESWEVVSLPMEYEPVKYFTSIGWKDPRQKEGEILWPERFPEYEVKRLKRELGSYGYAAQYQQRPAAKEGGIIKRDWIKHYAVPFNIHTLRNFDMVIQSWDLSFGDTGDYTCGQVWGKKGTDKFLLDQVSGKWVFTNQIQAIRNLRAKWPMTRSVLVEDKANGRAALDVLKKEIPGLIGIEPREIGGGDKTVRLSACSVDFEAGNIYIPSTNLFDWVEKYIHELVSFPKAKYDDAVDATSQALNWFAYKASNVSSMIINENHIRQLLDQSYGNLNNRVERPNSNLLSEHKKGETPIRDFSKPSRSVVNANSVRTLRDLFN